MDKEVRGLEEINFEKIKERFFYLNNLKFKRIGNSNVSVHKLRDASQRIKDKFEFKETKDLDKDVLKRVEEMVEKIKESSLFIRFAEDEGAVRAHIFHRITKQLLVVIPYIGRKEEDNLYLGKFNNRILSYYDSVFKGLNVDREV
ncbi:MAG: hypothetical protein NC822_07240 [Candidatus Omnitrophica bacterium]|nr:hypothetical protein [Candidatus Omnitrophota bacterium]MCM8827070.1 hypothetical protein [Candidatus Omnitrophota bacterium]